MKNEKKKTRHRHTLAHRAAQHVNCNNFRIHVFIYSYIGGRGHWRTRCYGGGGGGATHNSSALTVKVSSGMYGDCCTLCARTRWNGRKMKQKWRISWDVPLMHQIVSACGCVRVCVRVRERESISFRYCCLYSVFAIYMRPTLFSNESNNNENH